MAQSGGFRVELDVLSQKAQYVQELVPQIQSQLQALNHEMTTLFGTWRGQAASSFHRLHATWHQDYAQLNQSLDRIGEELHRNHRTYLTSDQVSSVNS